MELSAMPAPSASEFTIRKPSDTCELQWQHLGLAYGLLEVSSAQHQAVRCTVSLHSSAMHFEPQHLVAMSMQPHLTLCWAFFNQGSFFNQDWSKNESCAKLSEIIMTCAGELPVRE